MIIQNPIVERSSKFMGNHFYTIITANCYKHVYGSMTEQTKQQASPVR